MQPLKISYKSKIFRFWPLNRYDAIVLGRRIFTRLGPEAVSARLIRHELVHLEQIQRYGMLRFYLIYLCHYCKNLLIYREHWQAYSNIPFEIEAYARETQPDSEM